MRPLFLALVALALGLGVAACGSDDEQVRTVTVTQEADAADVETAPEEVEEEPDEDGDGTPDAEDFAPDDAAVQTEADATSCEALGINPEERKEGACEDEEGRRIKVVNRNSVLRLAQVAVKLNNVSHVQSIAREYESPLVGGFVVANVTITNRLNNPAEVDASEMFSLVLGNRTYNPNFDAMNDGANPLIYEELQPDQSATGDVIFSVPAKRARQLDRTGNLVILQFSDVGSFEDPSQRIGFIRTYG